MAGDKHYSLLLRQFVEQRMRDNHSRLCFEPPTANIAVRPPGDIWDDKAVFDDAYSHLAGYHAVQEHAMYMLVYTGEACQPLARVMLSYGPAAPWAQAPAVAAGAPTSADASTSAVAPTSTPTFAVTPASAVTPTSDPTAAASSAATVAPASTSTSASTAAAPAAAPCCACFNTAMAADDRFEAPCGAVYCRECLANLCSNMGDKLPSCACGGGGGGGGQPHKLEMTVTMAKALPTVAFSKWQLAHRASNVSTTTAECPQCRMNLVLPVFAQNFFCSSGRCINPRFGYCATCKKSIEDENHRCVSEEERRNEQLLRKYLARHGVHPCPGCKEAVVKRLLTDCHHMTCRCGARYCAACGHRFPVNRNGTANYTHACITTNVYNLIGSQRALVRQAYGEE